MRLTGDRVALISETTKGFGFGLLQDVDNLLRTLEKFEIGFEEFREYVTLLKEPRFHHRDAKEAREKLWVGRLPRCPSDGQPLQIRAAGEGESIWFCRKCDYSSYNDKPWYEILRELGIRKEVYDGNTSSEK